MKWRRFKIVWCLFTCFVCLTQAETPQRYQKRLERSQQYWENLRPSYSKLQYAGGIGLLSAGLGWKYGSYGQWETDAMMGFVPAYSTENPKITLTLKQNFLPWNKRPINNLFTFDPLSCGLAVNSILDGEFWVSEPDKYPSNYYSFSTKLRFWLHVGQRITLHIPEDKRNYAESVTFFYEISTCDLYLINAFNNRYLKPTDYLRLAFGLKFQVF